MAWHAYATGPIDWWEPWHGYDPPEVTPSRPDCGEARSDDDEAYMERLLFEMYSVAQEEFRQIGWEGDGAWYYAGIPGKTSGPEAILAVKQNNNGSVFVLSPLPLDWLK